MDYSTLNIAKLKLLPIFVPQATHVSDSMGNGCYLDAPGYPTHFTRSVYTSRGDNPSRGPQMVITYEGVHYVVETAEDWKPGIDWDAHYAQIQSRLHDLWVPLPLDHIRTRLWVEACYRHMNHCYTDDSKPERSEDHIFIYPVPFYKSKDAGQIEYWTKLATPENHAAVRCIRKFYPNYQPEQDLIDGQFKLYRADWWERDAERPAFDKCPGKYGHKHPMSKNWCQFCGWEEGK